MHGADDAPVRWKAACAVHRHRQPDQLWPGTRKARLFAAAGAADGDLLAFGMGRLVRVFTTAGLHKGTLCGHSLRSARGRD